MRFVRFVINWVVRPIFGIFIGQTAIQAAHLLGWYPERLLAAKLITLADPSSEQLSFIQWALATLIAGIFVLGWELIKRHLSGPNPPPTAPRKVLTDPEMDGLRRDVGALAEALTSYEPYESQKADVIARYERIKRSDHTAWIDNPLKQLRRDFLNRCEIAISDKKDFATAAEAKQVRSDITTFASEICLHLAAVPVAGVSGVQIFERRAVDPHKHREMVRLADAIEWVIDNSGCGEAKNRNMRILPAAVALRQAAKDGDLTISGRREINRGMPFENFDHTWDDIPKDYWSTHHFKLEAVCLPGAHEAVPETEPVLQGNLADASKPTYAMLRVWRDELQKRWPKA